MIITTEGSKYKTKSGGSWIISLEDGKHIVTCHNTNFGQVNQTLSYIIEVYTSLSTLLFLHHYSKNYKVQLNNTFTALYDNQTYINKLKEMTEDSYYFQNPYKNNESDALTIILQCIPPQFTIHHIYGHQDDNIERKNYPRILN